MNQRTCKECGKGYKTLKSEDEDPGLCMVCFFDAVRDPVPGSTIVRKREKTVTAPLRKILDTVKVKGMLFERLECGHRRQVEMFRWRWERANEHVVKHRRCLGCLERKGEDHG